MAITINGNGTIGGITAGGLPDGTVDTDVLAANAVTEAKLGSDEQKGLAKAWVNFNGTGTVAIRDSYNVSSITDNGIGDYTINFTNAMADTNFAVAGNARYGDNTATPQMRVVSICSLGTLANAMTTSSIRININYQNANTEDVQVVTATIFR